MQMFNEINCRRIDNEFNMFANIIHCPAFIIVWISCVILHLLLFQFGGIVLNTTTVTAIEWVWSIGIGAVSLLLGILLRLIPCGDKILLKPRAKKSKGVLDVDEGDEEVSELGDGKIMRDQSSSSYIEDSGRKDSESGNEKARLIR
eukprot:gnl/Chilomastix_caulleri/630.p2 GENE.gnl/Chilomastix_caulleri/630~~gnl/Chilomastix_caulleri/630.p2  ORF type:complete len:146 (+),score=29.32 gnl/Chilomastix_caulleri/630:173-610(+)